ncbi:MAG TPA: tyrosine/phenylalanine carboxypeptidase domain-containing protein, partial [Patescibacteria group bacterium]|nr:tyrosine/phenylalanine carboxypeptidase domain-containing protein [Patescibacteria group bacterium]
MSEKLSGETTYFPPQAYDEHLYETFADAASLQSYEYLNGNPEYRKEQKDKFLSGDIQNPRLDYPDIDLAKLTQAESDLLSMKQHIIANEQNEVVKQTYRWRLNEKIAEVRMLKAVASEDMSRFKRYCDFIYGKPSPDIFAYTVNSIRTKAEASINSEDETINRIASDLLKLLPVMNEPQITELPDGSVINYAHKQTLKEMGNLINIPEEVSKLDAAQIQEAFESALQQIGDTDWRVAIDEQTSRTAVSVNQEEMKVNIPQSRSVAKAKLAGLIVHEIGTHVARRVNGERSRLKLLGLGLDR